MNGHQPNLLPKHRVNAVRVLQIGTVAAVVASASMTWALVTGGSPAAPRTASIGTSVNSTGTPAPQTRSQQAPKVLSTGPVFSPASDTSADSVRFFDQLGRAFSVNPANGRLATISDVTIPGFVDAWWLPGSSRAIVKSQKGSGFEFRWHDFGSGQSAALRPDITSLAVSSDGRSVAYLAPSGDHSAVFTSNTDGTAPHAVLQTRISESSLSWPTAGSLALESRRADQSGWELTTVSTDGTLTPVLAGRENLATAWSRDGKLLLYSAFLPTQGVMLFVRDVATGVDVPLGIATSADKCAWTPDGSRVVCGVPLRSGLTGDVSAEKSATVDAIVSIDPASGIQETVWTPPSGTLLGVIHPLITASGKTFVFTNLFDHRLFSVSL